MDGTGAPLDEEWEHTTGVVVQHDRAPLERHAIGAGARPGEWSGERDVRVAKALRNPRDVSARGGPSDEAWLLQFRNSAKPFEPWLLGIGGDDLEVAQVAEGEERVAGAFAVVGAAGGGANTGGGFDDSDRVREIAAPGDDVIDGEWRRAMATPSRRLLPAWCACGG